MSLAGSLPQLFGVGLGNIEDFSQSLQQSFRIVRFG
jgi:hypothetical protein